MYTSSLKKNIPWINSLHFTNEDKHLIERGHSLYNKIINAAMTLLRNVRNESGISGLVDLVFAQEQGGFLCSDNGEGFVQIINAQGNYLRDSVIRYQNALVSRHIDLPQRRP